MVQRFTWRYGNADLITPSSRFELRHPADYVDYKVFSKEYVDRIKTADQFIEYLATRSSQSGEPYLIRFQDGREVQSAEFLREELQRIEEQAKSATKSAARE